MVYGHYYYVVCILGFHEVEGDLLCCKSIIRGKKFCNLNRKLSQISSLSV